MAPPPRELISDVISEILLRLPPDKPECLFRAALVCKSWLRTLSDPAFLRQYHDFHGAAPLLGLVDKGVNINGRARRFVPTTAVPAFPIPEESEDTHFAWTLDCRHGRVILGMIGPSSIYYLVYDPVTGDRRRVPEVGFGIIFMSLVHSAVAVFCATPGCDHLDCHGGPFRVVLVFTRLPTYTMWAAMYSSETGDWRAPVELDNVPYKRYCRGPLIGDEIYFALREAATIVKYDWANNSLSVVKPSPAAMYNGFVLMAMEDRSLGLAGIKDSRVHLWSQRASLEGTVEWVQCRVIDLEKMMPMANPSDSASAVGFAEGVGIIFISTGVGLFMMDLKSGRVRKVNEPGNFYNILPYMSFYSPDRLVGAPIDL